MTMFRVPGDFHSISAALRSSRVQSGDTILVNDGAYNQVVVVPYNKDVDRDEEKPAAEETPAGQVPDGPDEQLAAEPSAPMAEADARLPEPLTSPSVDVPDANPEEAVPVSRSSIQMIRVDQASPYLVTIHRSTWERGPEKRWNPFFRISSR